MKAYLIVIGLLVISLTLNGQDIQQSQYYNISLLMNPAFAGTSYAFRATANTRIQWNSLDAQYNTYIASLDYNWRKYNSGLGTYIVYDDQSNGTISRLEIAAQYAYWLSLNKSTFLRMAIQSSFNQRSAGNNFTLPNQFTGDGFDRDIPSVDIAGLENSNYMDFGAGTLLYNDKFWFGLSAFHLNRPNQSLVGATDQLDVKISAIAGYKFVIRQLATMRYLEEDNKELLSITPTIHYKSQGRSDQLDIGMYVYVKRLMTGFWYRGIPTKTFDENLSNNESIIFLFGIKLDQISIGYSFDNVISSLGDQTGGAHEFNLVYQFPKSKKGKKNNFKFLPCPSFFEPEN